MISSRTSSALGLIAAVRRRSPPPRLCFSPLSPYLKQIGFGRFLTTTSAAAAELVLSSVHWSETLEIELKNSNSLSNHESIIYITRELSKFPEKSSEFFNWIIQRKDFNPTPYLCGSVLRNFANLKAMPQFWLTLGNLRDQGYSIDKETYLEILSILKTSKISSDVKSFSKLYDSMAKDEAADAISTKISTFILNSDDKITVSQKKILHICPNFSDDIVMRVLRDLRKHPSKLLSFFEWVESAPGYTNSGLTHNAAVRVLSRGRSLKPFWSMVDKMNSCGYNMDIDTYTKISRHFQNVKLFEESVKLYEMMMDGPYKPSIRHCVFLLRSLSATTEPNLDLVSRVVDKYQRSGFTLSKATFDGIHRSMTSVGRFEDSEKVVNAMRSVGFEPDNVTHSQTIYGLCKAGRVEDAVNVVDRMEREGCRPDLKTWTILIQGCCKCGDLERALLCVGKMTCEVDGDLLDVLVEAFIAEGRVVGARTLFAEMVGNVRVRPWQHTYKRLIEALLGKRKLEEALGLLGLMKRHNYPPYPEPFDRYIANHGTVGDAREFLRLLSVKGYPSLGAYERMFRSFFEEGRSVEAKDLLFECPYHVRTNSQIVKLFGGVIETTAEIPAKPLTLNP